MTAADQLALRHALGLKVTLAGEDQRLAQSVRPIILDAAAPALRQLRAELLDHLRESVRETTACEQALRLYGSAARREVSTVGRSVASFARIVSAAIARALGSRRT